MHQLGDHGERHAPPRTAAGRRGARREQREKRTDPLAAGADQRFGCGSEVSRRALRGRQEKPLQPVEPFRCRGDGQELRR